MTEEAEWGPADAARFLRRPSSDAHKYSRGVLGMRTGSSAYPGAAVLGAEAAWRTGIGLVRYVSPIGDAPPQHGLPTPAAAILAVRPETVFAGPSDDFRIDCDAWLIGSGTEPASRSRAERDALLELLGGVSPVVVDAGALGLLAEAAPKAPVIATPHLGEFRTLWRAVGIGELPDETPARSAVRLARALGATILLKGSTTRVVSPDGRVLITGPATSWLATAGTGDVLAGILGALTATHAAEVRRTPGALAELGATACVLHDAAARLAARRAGGDDEHPVTALDVARAVPDAFASLSA